MPRPPRAIEPGAIHHVGHHCNVGRALFATDRDRRAFLRMVLEVVDVHEVDVLAWCLMGNHYHLLLTDPLGRLTEAMRMLNSGFARRCNARDRTRGVVMWERYFGATVRTDRHLLAAVRYIALNPVAAGFVDRAARWPWSSHLAVARGVVDPLVRPEALLRWFDSPARCRAWVEDAEAASPATWFPPSRLPAPVLAEVRPTLDALRALGRDDGIVAARRWHYGVVETAAAFGVSKTTVSRRAREAGWEEVPGPVSR